MIARRTRAQERKLTNLLKRREAICTLLLIPGRADLRLRSLLAEVQAEIAKLMEVK